MAKYEFWFVTFLITFSLVLMFDRAFFYFPNFAGSLTGSIIGMLATLAMLFPLAYMIIKRNAGLKNYFKQYTSMSTLLKVHIYVGGFALLLAIVHSGNDIHSPLGIALITLALLVVMSGYIGREILTKSSKTLRERKEELDVLMDKYDEAAIYIERSQHDELIRNKFNLKQFSGQNKSNDDSSLNNYLSNLMASILELEYTIKFHKQLKRRFKIWLDLHIIASMLLYALIFWHIFVAVMYGVRWL